MSFVRGVGMLLLCVGALAAGSTPAAGARPLVLTPETVAVPGAVGTVIGVHGGAWLLQGSESLMAMPRPALSRWRAAGWSSVNIDYRPGAAALEDVMAAVAASARGGRLVCLYGESAGGHLALLVATRMRVDCVETVGAPTDLASLPSGDVRRAADIAFRTRLAAFSPSRYRSSTPVLAAHAVDDPVVPFAQVRRLRWGGVHVLPLEPGEAFLVHSGISPRAQTALEVAEAGLRARACARATTRCAGAQ